MNLPGKRDEQTYAVIGSAMTVHRILGHGVLEPVYQDALEQEFILQNVPFSREVCLPVYYRGKPLKTGYRVDFICFDAIWVELKALKTISSAEESQMINDLKASHLNRALLINFGGPGPEHRRFALDRPVTAD